MSSRPVFSVDCLASGGLVIALRSLEQAQRVAQMLVLGQRAATWRPLPVDADLVDEVQTAAAAANRAVIEVSGVSDVGPAPDMAPACTYEIGASAAAEVLRVDARQVRRMAAREEFHHQRQDDTGRWFFDAAEVAQVAARRRRVA